MKSRESYANINGYFGHQSPILVFVAKLTSTDLYAYIDSLSLLMMSRSFVCYNTHSWNGQSHTLIVTLCHHCLRLVVSYRAYKEVEFAEHFRSINSLPQHCVTIKHIKFYSNQLPLPGNSSAS